MCGIAGVIGDNDIAAARKAVGEMTCALARRGPNGSGIEVWQEAVLGHRRLAIFDLSPAGRQPMMSPDRGIGVVFNGAIYNFRELRSDLERSRYKFTSNTDTEVLIHGYTQWGIDGLVHRLRGMFAFGLWDDAAGKLFLVRDRLGVKPLVYAVRGHRIAFASTIRALRAAELVTEIDQEAMAEYLEFGFVPDHRTIYRGAAKVPAASIVEWSRGNLQTREYWSPPEVKTSDAPSFEEAVEETEQLFLRAVNKRLYADVPVGALLSGGVDSSLVCWAIAKLGGNITAYTIGTPGDPWDETSDARLTARKLDISHRIIEITDTDTPDLEELVSAYGEPFACPSALGMLRVSRGVAAAATVLLTGDGGDDVFLGYPEHRHLWFAQKLAHGTPAFAATAWRGLRNVFPRRGFLRRARSFMDYATGGLGAVISARDGFLMYQRNNLLGPRLATADISLRRMPWSLASGRNVLSEFLTHDRRMRFVGEYLTKVDGATMHHGLEARSPFLDQELWEYAASLPFDIRLREGRLKAILRELAHRKIGDRVARGQKRGFGIPVQRWLGGCWRNDIQERFRDSVLDKEGWIDSGAVLAQLEKASTIGLAPLQLWYIVVLESWLRHEQHHKSVIPAEDTGIVSGSLQRNREDTIQLAADL